MATTISEVGEGGFFVAPEPSEALISDEPETVEEELCRKILVQLRQDHPRAAFDACDQLHAILLRKC